MTMRNQDFDMYAGETKNIKIQVTDAIDLAGSTVIWSVLESEFSTTPSFQKTGASITISGNTLTVKVTPADTEMLFGEYFHKCKMTDQTGNVSYPATGTITIYK